MLLAERAKHRCMVLDAEIIGSKASCEFAPSKLTKREVGALYETLERHLVSSGTTQAFAKGAGMSGATIETHC